MRRVKESALVEVMKTHVIVKLMPSEYISVFVVLIINHLL